MKADSNILANIVYLKTLSPLMFCRVASPSPSTVYAATEQVILFYQNTKFMHVGALSHSSPEICVYLASLYTEHNIGLSVSQAFSFNPPYLHCFHCIVLICF